MGQISKTPKLIAIAFVRLYRYTISPYLAPSCRFTPSCSEYAMVSIERFGAFKGIWMASKRILKCHPFHPGGYDPVPEESNVIHKVHNQ